MPSQPVDVIKRSSRWAGQHWLLDAVIGLVGPEWDQGRVAYYAAACAQDSQVDFTAVRPCIRKYDDSAREFSKAARRREVLARDAVHRGHRASVRESYFTAAVLYGAAQWAQRGDGRGPALRADLRRQLDRRHPVRHGDQRPPACDALRPHPAPVHRDLRRPTRIHVSRSDEPLIIDVTAHAHNYGRPGGAWEYQNVVSKLAERSDIWLATRAEITGHYQEWTRAR